MNYNPQPPKKPFQSRIKRPSTFGRKYNVVSQSEQNDEKKSVTNNEIVEVFRQNITKIDTTIRNLPKPQVLKKKETNTKDLLPFIPMSH